MSHKQAFNIPIDDGKARIFLRFNTVECEAENNAPDFISFENDKPVLTIYFPVDTALGKQEREIGLEIVKNEGANFVLKVTEEGLFFDINVDDVKDIWLADLQFNIQSSNPRYLAYYIRSLEYQYEWLQRDMSSGEIKLLSISKKKYKAPKISGKEIFSAKEVIICADMLSRAIHKIDLRTGGAYIKLNTEKGHLEPLIIEIADKLGYKIEALDKKDRKTLSSGGENLSHSIFLKKQIN